MKSHEVHRRLRLQCIGNARENRHQGITTAPKLYLVYDFEASYVTGVG